MTREEILLDYAEYAQKEQNYMRSKGQQLTNYVLIRPILNIFHGEHMANVWRNKIRCELKVY